MRGCHFLYWGTREKILRGDGGSAGTARYRPVRWTSCRLSSRELLKKGIRWGAAGLWKYCRRESAGERWGYGNTTEGNPLGSGGAMEILQKGIRWGAAGLWKYYKRESAGERRGFGNTTEGNPLGTGGAMEILQKGIRWGPAGLWKYYRRESAGERSREWGWRWLGSLNGIDTPV